MNDTNKAVKYFMVIWAVVNLIMLPAYAVNIENLQKPFISEDKMAFDIIEPGSFSKISPLDQKEKESKDTNSLPVPYIFYLLGLLSLGFAFRFRNKKAQVTMYIIIGILILAAMLIFISMQMYSRYQEKIKEEQYDYFQEQTVRINEYIRNCVSLTGYDGLRTLGERGGYIEVPEYIYYQGTAFWHLDEANIQPLLNETKTRLVNYVNDNLEDCFDFSQYEYLNFSIEIEDIDTEVVFGDDDTTITVFLPVNIKYGQFEQRYDRFIEKYDVRFRRIWELASKVSNRFLDTDFDHTDPLSGIDEGDFELSAENPQNEYLVYKIEDKQKFIFGKNDYVFRFAYKHGPSQLTRRVQLQENCNTIPNYWPQIIYSSDRDAHLIIRPGTTFFMPGGACEISIQQSYEKQAMRQIQTGQFHDHDFGFSIPTMGTVTWNLNHPVYNIGPTGTKASKSMRLNLYWDQDYNPIIGPVGILRKHGMGAWEPIDTNPVYSEHYTWTEINGFSKFTLVDCGLQMPTTSEAESSIKPEWPCFLFLAIMVLVVIVTLGAGLTGIGIIQGAAGVLEGIGGSVLGAMGISGGVVAGGVTTSLVAGAGIVGGGSVGLGALSGLTYPGGDDDCVSFTPTCDGVANVKKSEKDGKGACSIQPKSMIGDVLQTAGEVGGGASELGESVRQGAPSLLASFGGRGVISDKVSGKDDIVDLFKGFVNENPDMFSDKVYNVTVATYSDDLEEGVQEEFLEEVSISVLFDKFIESQPLEYGENMTISKSDVLYLFGNFLGEFPGALQDSNSLIEATDGFTAYLDENSNLFESEEEYDEFGEQPDFLAALQDTLSPIASLATMFADSSIKYVQGGHTYKACSTTTKCDTLHKLLCMKCSTKCKVMYR